MPLPLIPIIAAVALGGAVIAATKGGSRPGQTPAGGGSDLPAPGTAPTNPAAYQAGVSAEAGRMDSTAAAFLAQYGASPEPQANYIGANDALARGYPYTAAMLLAKCNQKLIARGQAPLTWPPTLYGYPYAGGAAQPAVIAPTPGAVPQVQPSLPAGYTPGGAASPGWPQTQPQQQPGVTPGGTSGGAAQPAPGTLPGGFPMPGGLPNPGNFPIPGNIPIPGEFPNPGMPAPQPPAQKVLATQLYPKFPKGAWVDGGEVKHVMQPGEYGVLIAQRWGKPGGVGELIAANPNGGWSRTQNAGEEFKIPQSWWAALVPAGTVPQDTLRPDPPKPTLTGSSTPKTTTPTPPANTEVFGPPPPDPSPIEDAANMAANMFRG